MLHAKDIETLAHRNALSGLRRPRNREAASSLIEDGQVGYTHENGTMPLPPTPQQSNLADSRWNPANSPQKSLKNENAVMEPALNKTSADDGILSADPLAKFEAAWQLIHRKPEDKDTSPSIPTKVLPVSGVPPHLWHKHQGTSDLSAIPAGNREPTVNINASTRDSPPVSLGDAEVSTHQQGTPTLPNPASKNVIDCAWSGKPVDEGWKEYDDDEGNDPEDPLGYGMTYGPDGAPRLPYPHELSMGYQASKPKTKKAHQEKEQTSLARALSASQPRPVALPPETPPVSNVDSSGPFATSGGAAMGAWKDPAWGPAKLSEADRRRLRLPKPNNNFSVSDRSEISTVIISDDGLNEVGDSTGEPDIRNDIAPKHDIHNYDGKWITHTWDGEASRKVASHSFVQTFVYAWMDSVPADIEASFLTLEIDQHWRHDVDTETGRLVAVVDYPETLQHPEVIEEGLAFRQLTLSSTLIMQEEQKRPKNRHGRRQSLQPRSITSQRKFAHAPRPRTPSPPPGYARIACHMRPAAKGDMEEVSQIYNLEVKREDNSTLDVDELSEFEFIALFKACQDDGAPFIVIVDGSPIASAACAGRAGPKHPGGPSQFRNGQHGPKGKILGFGLISTFMTGITGRYSTMGSQIGRFVVVVHPAFRRKGLGTICADKLLSMVDSEFHGDAKYDFVNPDGETAGKEAEPGKNTVRHLIVEVLVRRDMAQGKPQTAEPDKNQWIGDFLDGKFQFSKLSTLKNISDARSTLNGPVHEMNLVTYTRACGAGMLCSVKN